MYLTLLCATLVLEEGPEKLANKICFLGWSDQRSTYLNRIVSYHTDNGSMGCSLPKIAFFGF
jgi:hypothetical protein